MFEKVELLLPTKVLFRLHQPFDISPVRPIRHKFVSRKCYEVELLLLITIVQTLLLGWAASERDVTTLNPICGRRGNWGVRDGSVLGVTVGVSEPLGGEVEYRCSRCKRNVQVWVCCSIGLVGVGVIVGVSVTLPY